MEQSPRWDEAADSWDQDDATHFYAAAAFSSLGETTDSRGITLSGSDAIDFGCGTGLLTEKLVTAGASVYAVDVSQAMLDVLIGKIATHGWTTVQTGTEVPSNSGYDLIVCSSVCSFLEDYPATVVDLVQRLRPGGLFVQWDWERVGDDSHGLDRAEISDALARAGLVEISVGPSFDISINNETQTPLMGCGQLPGGQSTN